MTSAHLLTVESNGWSSVCVLSILEPVQDGCLATAVQPDHDAVVAAAAAEADQGGHQGLLAHVRPHAGALLLPSNTARSQLSRLSQSSVAPARSQL